MNDLQQDILSDIVEQPKPATIGKRIAAALIDGLILTGVFILIGNFFGQAYEKTTTTTSTVTTSTDSSTPTPTSTTEVTTSRGIHLEGWPALLFMICWCYLMPVREALSGQTFGKKIVGIKVVRSDSSPIGMGAAFVRHLFDIIDCFFLIGLIIAASNPDHKRIGDRVAGTYVVDKV